MSFLSDFFGQNTTKYKLQLGIDHTIRDRNNKCAKTLAMEQNDSLSIFGHLIDTLMQG